MYLRFERLSPEIVLGGISDTALIGRSMREHSALRKMPLHEGYEDLDKSLKQ